jgi:hypothetical protein
MTPIASHESGAPRPALQSWRTTTAVRVFALALSTGVILGNRIFVETAPLLIVLILLSIATSLLEWMTRNRPTHWHTVAEAVAATTLVVATGSLSELGSYLAVPTIVAGVRHGLVTTLNVFLISGLTLAATLAADPTSDYLTRLGQAGPWLAIGLGVGLLASWQSRTTRHMAARQAPYDTAHQLMERIHRLASSGKLGLDSMTLADDLELAMRDATTCARVTVFVVEPDATLRALNGGDDVARLAAEISLPEHERTPGAAVVPLRGVQQTLGYCVLVGVPRWTSELDERALQVADEFAVRLDTAVLFDDVRSRRRSATASPGRCTTESPRRSSVSATSWTRSSPSAPTGRRASSPPSCARRSPDSCPRSGSPSSTCATRSRTDASRRHLLTMPAPSVTRRAFESISRSPSPAPRSLPGRPPKSSALPRKPSATSASMPTQATSG